MGSEIISCQTADGAYKESDPGAEGCPKEHRNTE